MIATPTTTVDVLRGTTVNVFQDAVETEAVIIAGVRASIIERRQQIHEPKGGEDRIVRVFKGRIPRGTGVLKGDRLRDAAGAIYAVDNVYQQANPFWPQDQSLDLSLTD